MTQVKQQIRVQRRECSGVNRNPYRNVMTWTPWRTVAKYDDIEPAREAIDLAKRRGGLYQFRIMQGKTVIM